MHMIFAIPISVLVGTIAAFFALARGSYRSFGATQTVLRVLAALPLLASGLLLHFFRAHATASIIPPFFPTPMFLTIFTGVCEIAGAIGLFFPQWRRPASFWIAVMMVAVFPANVYAAGQLIDGLQMPSVPVRLAMQVVYIVLVLLAGFGMPSRGRAL
jgi:uncharacterized membrane protein